MQAVMVSTNLATMVQAAVAVEKAQQVEMVVVAQVVLVVWVRLHFLLGARLLVMDKM
jgi:hypothetical protein